MHGTFVEGVRVHQGQPKLCHNGTILTFGCTVTRGPGSLAMDQKPSGKPGSKELTPCPDTDAFPARSFQLTIQWPRSKYALNPFSAPWPCWSR